MPPKIATLRNDGAHVGIQDGPNLLSLYRQYGENPSCYHDYMY
jgi:hypothetical protein